MTTQNTTANLYRDLFDRGLGDVLILGQQGDAVFLGNLTKEKGKLVLKDRGLLGNTRAEDVAPCWDLGIVGAVADVRGRDWESLTFVGPDHCKIPVDLSTTRNRVLGRSVIKSGESVLSYCGSIYRGFKLMMDSNLLPLVLPIPIAVEGGISGLAVTDFRFATVSLETVREVNDAVRASVDRYTTLSVEELDVGDEEFDSMFAQFRK